MLLKVNLKIKENGDEIYCTGFLFRHYNKFGVIVSKLQTRKFINKDLIVSFKIDKFYYEFIAEAENSSIFVQNEIVFLLWSDINFNVNQIYSKENLYPQNYLSNLNYKYLILEHFKNIFTYDNYNNLLFNIVYLFKTNQVYTRLFDICSIENDIYFIGNFSKDSDLGFVYNSNNNYVGLFVKDKYTSSSKLIGFDELQRLCNNI